MTPEEIIAVRARLQQLDEIERDMSWVRQGLGQLEACNKVEIKANKATDPLTSSYLLSGLNECVINHTIDFLKKELELRLTQLEEQLAKL